MIPANKQVSSVAIWGFLQLGLLGIGASGFPLWAHHPLPHESLALPILLVGQTILITQLFGRFLPGGASLCAGVLLMIPMDELAGILSNSPQVAICRCFFGLSLWMMGFSAIAWCLNDVRHQLLIAMIGTLWTAGGAVLDYLRWETTAASGQTGAFTPISLLPRLCLACSEHGLPWVQLLMPGITAAIVMALTRIKNHPKFPSTLLHQREKKV